MKPNSGERREGVGGTFVRLTLFNAATHQELLGRVEGGGERWGEERLRGGGYICQGTRGGQ